ncbi:MAG: hypothetical protein JW779_03070 [Candidatus Thorarchaeota archaeon]|nr:hypothetical protein [Candidatus Thorarchaeota archaeon]
MEISDPKMTSTSSFNKYRRVFPIFGILLFYLGGLIISLEVANATIFLVQIAAFPIILIIGLAIIKREVILLGEVLIIIGSVGPLAEFYLSINGGELLGYGAIGGSLVAVAFFFHLLGIYAWMK